MPKLSMLAVILMSCVLTLVSTPSQADLDAQERAEIQREIEAYIKANPEILRDALMALAEREEAKRRRGGIMLVRDDVGDPVMGNPNGTITIYEFSDYNCGYCKRMFGTLRDLLEENTDLRMVVKEFPILSQSSLTAAKAGIAAQKQGKFAPFHIAMMTHRGQVNDASILKATQEAEINLASFQRDMASDETVRIIERTRAAAGALGLNGTPAFVVGDTIIPGAVDAKQLQAVIDDVRTKQR